jgi:branched-chain amino acid transport system substrate-binding protein
MNKKMVWGIVIVAIIILGIYLTNKTPGADLNNPIKVGAVLPLTGGAAYFGEEVKKGMEVCNPGNLSFVFEDSFATPQQGISAYNKLTKIDKVDATVVAMSSVVPAILPIAKENKDFVITTVVSAADVGKIGGESVFRYFTDGYLDAKVITGLMMDKGIKKVGLMQLKNELGDTYKRGVDDFAKENNMAVYAETFLPTDTEYSTALLKLKQNNVESILVVGMAPQTLQIIKKIKELGLDVKIFTGWMMADPTIQKGNEQVLEGVYSSSPYFLLGLSGEVKEFNDAYKTKYNTVSNIYAAIGCDLSKMIGVNNLRNYKQLESLKIFKGVNGEIPQAEFGEFYFPLKMTQFVGGVSVVQ